MQNALYHSCSLFALNFQQSRHDVLGVAFGLICASIIDFDEPTDDYSKVALLWNRFQCRNRFHCYMVYGLFWIYSNYIFLQQKHKNRKNSIM